MRKKRYCDICMSECQPEELYFHDMIPEHPKPIIRWGKEALIICKYCKDRLGFKKENPPESTAQTEGEQAKSNLFETVITQTEKLGNIKMVGDRSSESVRYNDTSTEFEGEENLYWYEFTDQTPVYGKSLWLSNGLDVTLVTHDKVKSFIPGGQYTHWAYVLKPVNHRVAFERFENYKGPKMIVEIRDEVERLRKFVSILEKLNDLDDSYECVYSITEMIKDSVSKLKILVNQDGE